MRRERPAHSRPSSVDATIVLPVIDHMTPLYLWVSLEHGHSPRWRRDADRDVRERLREQRQHARGDDGITELNAYADQQPLYPRLPAGLGSRGQRKAQINRPQIHRARNALHEI